VPPPAPVAAEVAAIRDRLARALTLELLGRYEESLAIARDASATAERLGYAPVHAEALTQVARAVGTRSTADARALAQRLYFEALGIAEAERHDQLTVEIWNKLVMLAVRMDSSMAQAHAWWGQAYAWSRRNAVAVHGAGDDAYEEARLHHVLGEIYYRESEYAKAVDEERRAIAAISRSRAHQLELIRYYDALAKSLEVLDGLDEAMRLHERALAIATETLGADHPNVLSLKINYGKALEKCGRLDRARSVLEDALASMPARYRDAHPDAARIHSFLSSLDYTQGHLDRAAEHGRASLAIYERTLSPDHVRLAEAYTNLANVEIKRRSFDHARALYEDALVLRRRHLGNDHYLIGVNEGSIAEALVDLERPGEALPHLREAERIFTRGSGHERETQAWILTVRGELLAGERQFGAAVPVLERALALFSDDAADPTNHALAMWTLARALHELGSDRDRVRSLAERAHAIFTALGAVEAYDRDAVARFLDRLPGRQARRHPRTGSGPKQ
jgi:tetratricopeptide (TPR) repeat protein